MVNIISRKVTQQSKPVIIVLSPGRTGSSLLMQVLFGLGLTLSGKLLGSHHTNPDGFFEDSNIVELHKKLILELGTEPNLPLFEGWNKTNAAAQLCPTLRNLVEEYISQAETIWGFKDPRTCEFLPLWIDVLKPMWLVPKFILSMRNPSTVVLSMIKQAQKISPEIAELIWLYRTCNVLFHSGGDCFIVHYEDWFRNPTPIAEDLLSYTGLDQYFAGNVTEILSRVIKPNLNRSVHEDYQIQNEYVIKLYDVLKDCRGADFDRARLMAVVKECRQAMDGFKGWYLIAQENIARAANLREQLQAAKEKQAEIPELRKRIQQLERENRRLSQMETEILRAEQALNHLTELYPPNPPIDHL